MSKLVIAFIVLVALQAALAKPKKAAAQPVATKSQLDQLTTQVQSAVANVTTALGIKDIPDTQQTVEFLQQQLQALGGHAKTISDGLKKEISAHKGDIDNALETASNKLSEAATSIQNIVGPEATNRGQELKKGIEDGLTKTLDAISKLVKDMEPDATRARDSIANLAQKALDDMLSTTRNIQNQIVSSHEKTHKN